MAPSNYRPKISFINNSPEKIEERRTGKRQRVVKKNFTDDEWRDYFEHTESILSSEEERVMIGMYRSDRSKLNYLLYRHNMKAAVNLATKYFTRYQYTVLNKQYQLEDFVSSAGYGLWQAAGRFDLDRQFDGKPIKFITYATPWMFRYVIQHFYDKGNMILTKSLDQEAYNNDSGSSTVQEVLNPDEIDLTSSMINVPDDDAIFDNLDAEPNPVGYEEFEDAKKTKEPGGISEETAMMLVDKLLAAIDAVEDDDKKRAVLLYLSKKVLRRLIPIVQNRIDTTRIKKLLMDCPRSKQDLLTYLGMDEPQYIAYCDKMTRQIGYLTHA